jgi:transcriptional regulator with XRE-family HTH domain
LEAIENQDHDSWIVEFEKTVDEHVGARVRLRRNFLDMSQTKLGEALDITFQQVQKYERGANRISASRLFHLGEVLDVPISFFFDDMPSMVALKAFSPTKSDSNLAERKEVGELTRAYYEIPDKALRHSLCEIMRAMSHVKTSGAASDAMAST